MIFGPCGACKHEKWLVRKRTYNIPKEILDKNPHFTPMNGMKSDVDLCTKCFKDIRRITLGF